MLSCKLTMLTNSNNCRGKLYSLQQQVATSYNHQMCRVHCSSSLSLPSKKQKVTSSVLKGDTKTFSNALKYFSLRMRKKTAGIESEPNQLYKGIIRSDTFCELETILDEVSRRKRSHFREQSRNLILVVLFSTTQFHDMF